MDYHFGGQVVCFGGGFFQDVRKRIGSFGQIPVGMDAEIGGRSLSRQIESGRTVEAEITKPVFSQKPYDFLAGWLDGHVCRVFNGTGPRKIGNASFQ